ncbi:MAG: hypothetical protein AAF745_05465, partial [Planctomycetota bacterium]
GDDVWSSSVTLSVGVVSGSFMGLEINSAKSGTRTKVKKGGRSQRWDHSSQVHGRQLDVAFM